MERKFLMIPMLVAILALAEFSTDAHAYKGPAPAFLPPPPAAPRIRLGVSGVFDWEGGMRIVSVLPGMPAEKVGIEPGDQILTVNGTLIRKHEDMQFALDMAEQKHGGHISMLIRSGRDFQYYQVDADIAVVMVYAAVVGPQGKAGPQGVPPAQQPNPKLDVKNIIKKKLAAPLQLMK